MNIELEMLAWSILLGLAYVFVASGITTHERGLKWNTGNRGAELKPLSALAARANRASHNFLETFPFFAAAVLAVTLAHRNTAHSALGSELYFWARVVYLPLYLIGIPYVRTLVWLVSVWGLLQIVATLL
jgi:uncharacterized MAPEG superfamily protein